jgi:hypothetical protein
VMEGTSTPLALKMHSASEFHRFSTDISLVIKLAKVFYLPTDTQ